METYKPILPLSITAAADLSKHLFAGFDGNICGANAKALGVIDADTKSGQQAPINALGVALVLSGGAIDLGAEVTSDADGKAVAVADLAAAASVVTLDSSKATIGADKLTIDSGATPVTSTAANGDVITPAADAIDLADGVVALADPVLSGGVLPVAVNGRALKAATGADELIPVLLA